MKKYLATVVVFLFLFGATQSGANAPITSNSPGLHVTEGQYNVVLDRAYDTGTGFITIRGSHRIHRRHGVTRIVVDWRDFDGQQTFVDIDTPPVR